MASVAETMRRSSLCAGGGLNENAPRLAWPGRACILSLFGLSETGYATCAVDSWEVAKSKDIRLARAPQPGILCRVLFCFAGFIKSVATCIILAFSPVVCSTQIIPSHAEPLLLHHQKSNLALIRWSDLDTDPWTDPKPILSPDPIDNSWPELKPNVLPDLKPHLSSNS